MNIDYEEEWGKRLNPKRFRSTTATNVPKGWNPFDSDFARITMSAPFRRLQDKAQVFPLEPNDFIRTRLTHSIEVSSVARSLGVRLEGWLFGEKIIKESQLGHIPSILATASLIHDIGNPPFGHFGEKCIRNFFSENKKELLSDFNDKEKADLLNFDGNVQGFRLLLRLGLASDEYSYNLTFPTLATVVKYPKDSTVGNDKKGNVSSKKYGYYQSEKEKYEKISETLNLSGERHPLCFLLEAADDICYSVSDIEDGFKKKTINIKFLIETLEKDNYKDDTECSELKNKIIDWSKQYNGAENISSLIAQKCRIFSHHKMIESSMKRFIDNHDDIIKGFFLEELIQNSPSYQLANFFKEIADKNFIHESVIKSEIVGAVVISTLLDKLTCAVLSDNYTNKKTLNGKLYSLLSHQARYAMKKTKYENKKYLKLLMVLDFITSMTDSYALSLYRELSGITL